MADIAKHIRIFNTNPTDDFVTKRITAINAIEAIIKKKVSGKEIFEFSNGLLSALQNPEEPNEIVNSVSVPALKKSSTSFVADDESLQLLTCTLLAALQHIEKGKGFAQRPTAEFILAVTLWNGLSFQRPIADKEKLEVLRMELQDIATKIATDISNTSRQRKETKLRLPLAPTENTWASYVAASEASYGKLIDAFRVNSILDREELDILWWSLGGWSEVCKVPISTLNPVQSAMVSAVEIGQLLRRFPSKSHTHLACRGTTHREEFTGAELIAQLDNALAKIVEILPAKDSGLYKNIFPVSNLLINSEVVAGEESKYTLHEWSARLLIELSLVNLNKFAE